MLFGDDCHCTEPVCPDKVNKVEFVPAQTVVVAGVIEPATDTGLTLITTLAVFAEGQTPLVMTAR